MRLELIRENKLKITIGKDELSDYGLSPEAMTGNSESARAMFFSVLKKAETEVGFVYANSKLVVEAMPGKDDIIIYVTKVGNEIEKQLYDRISSRQNERTRKIELPREKQEKKSNCMAELDSLDSLIEMCNAMPTYFGGTLYSLDGRYYVVIDGAMERFVSEYGRILDERAQLIVEEHAERVIHCRAFDIIRNYFEE